MVSSYCQSRDAFGRVSLCLGLRDGIAAVVCFFCQQLKDQEIHPLSNREKQHMVISAET